MKAKLRRKYTEADQDPTLGVTKKTAFVDKTVLVLWIFLQILAIVKLREVIIERNQDIDGQS